MSRRRSKRLSQDPDKTACHFCGCSEDDEVKYGKLWNHDGIVTHYYCLLLSSNMEQNGEDNEGILGFMPADIQKELRRGKKLSCYYCKRNGATLGCCHPRCKRVFHLPCGLQADSLHQFFGEFRSYCVTHRIHQEIDEHIKREAAAAGTVICCICYEDVSPNNPMRTLWAPCCRKNAWFHRDCVQRLALSAGYFFKCPLCNNKREFQQAMLDHGIYIPNQDASWELVPNAFQELLHRHDSCDAVECICPKGRSHTSVNAKWELLLCRLCGSQGIHKACGNVKWSDSTWDCAECANMLDKVADNSSPGTEAIKEVRIRLMPEDSDDDSDISVVGDSPLKPIIEDRHSPPPVILPGKIRPGPRSFKLKQAVQNVTSTESAASSTSDIPLLENRVQSSSTSSDLIADALSNETDDEKSSILDISGEIDSTDTKPGSAEPKSDYPQVNEPLPEKTQTLKGFEQLTSEIISLDSDDEVEIINVPQVQNVLTTKNGVKIEIHNLPKLPVEFQKVERDSDVIISNSPRRIPSPHDLISSKKSVSLVNRFENSASYLTPHCEETSILGTEFSAITNADTTAAKLIEDSDDSDLIVVDERISRPSAMNIKITNVTSLRPQVAAKVALIKKKPVSILSKPRPLKSDDEPIQLVETENQITEVSNTSPKSFQPSSAAVRELGLKRKDKFFANSDSVTSPLNGEVGLWNKKPRVSQSPQPPTGLQNTDDDIHMLNNEGESNYGTYGTTLVPSTSNTRMSYTNKSRRKQQWGPADIKTNNNDVFDTFCNADKNKEKEKNNGPYRFSSITETTSSVKIPRKRSTNSENISINGYSPIRPECHGKVSETPSHAQAGRGPGLRNLLPKTNIHSTTQIDDSVLFNVPQILTEPSDRLVDRQQISEQHTSHCGETVDSSSHQSSQSTEINGGMSLRNESRQTTQTSMFTSSSSSTFRPTFLKKRTKKSTVNGRHRRNAQILSTSSPIAQAADGISITSGCDGRGAGSNRAAEARSGFHEARRIPIVATAESIIGQHEFDAESQARHGACHDPSVCVTANSANLQCHFSTSFTRGDCHRLIPNFVSLKDLKFRLVESRIVQIIVSDTITLNVGTSTADDLEKPPAEFSAVRKCDSINNFPDTSKTIDLSEDSLRRTLTDPTDFEHLLNSREVQGSDSEAQSSIRNPCKNNFCRQKTVFTFEHEDKNSSDVIDDACKRSVVPIEVEELSEIVERTSARTVRTNCINNQSKTDFVGSSKNIAMKYSRKDENVSDPKPSPFEPRHSIKVKIDLNKIQHLMRSQPELFNKHTCAMRTFENYHEPESPPVLTILQKVYNPNNNKQSNTSKTLIDESVNGIKNLNPRKKFKYSQFYRDHLKS